MVSTRSIPPGCGPEPRAKQNNYLNHIFVKEEASRAGANIGISLDTNGYVAECEGANIFIVKRELIITPPKFVGILEGVTRETVFEIAKSLKYEVEEKLFTTFDLYSADEIFATSTAGGIHPIIEVDSRVIHNGKAGAITEDITRVYNQMLEKGEHGIPVWVD